MRDIQQSSGSKLACLARLLQPDPPQVPHPGAQQKPSLSTPAIPLLHDDSAGTGVGAETSSIMHGAAPESLQCTPESLMREMQQSSDIKPASLARLLQPKPPHMPQPRAQQ